MWSFDLRQVPLNNTPILLTTAGLKTVEKIKHLLRLQNDGVQIHQMLALVSPCVGYSRGRHARHAKQAFVM